MNKTPPISRLATKLASKGIKRVLASVILLLIVTVVLLYSLYLAPTTTESNTSTATSPLPTTTMPVPTNAAALPALVLPKTPIAGLSLFEPYAGGCEWQYYDIAKAKRALITRLSADCGGIHVSWHPRGIAALVWINNETDGLMVWNVDLVRKQAKRLPTPPLEAIERFAFDRAGRRLAFAAIQEQETRLVSWQLDLPTTGLAGEATWRPFETVVINNDGGADFSVLPSFTPLFDPENLAAWQSSRLDARPASKVISPTLRSLLSRQVPRTNSRTDGEWRQIKLPSWQYSLLQWYMHSETNEPTGLLAFIRDKPVIKVVKLILPYQPRDFVDPRIVGTWLLLTDHRSGMRPHLYDMRSGKLIFGSNVAHETTFWPPIPAPGSEAD